MIVYTIMFAYCLFISFFFFFNDTATTEIYTLSLHDALPICTGTSSWTDAAGNPGTASNTFAISENTVAPTVVVSGASPTLNASQTDLITFTFSEAVIGFDLADLAVSGGTLGAITAVDATHYTATFTPTIGATAAAIQVLASGTGTSSWTDAAGNPGTASNTFAISENTVAPTVVVSGASPTLNASQTDLITFTFSEAVIGFDLADLAVSGGTLGAITAVDATHYTATFTPTIGATAAAIQVLASGTGTSSWTDAAGNPGTASNTFAISENTVAPTVVVSGASPTLNASQTDLITFTFSEAVIGFDLADLAVSGGTLGAITAVDATHYTATFTPTIGATAAAIQVLASGTGTSSWTDAAGNPGTASNTFAISENTVAPTVVVSGASPTLNASQTDLITFTFSEAVIGFDLADLAVSGGTLGAITAVDATHYTATFTPTIGATAAAIQVLASGTGTSSWTDAAGNPGTASNTFAISENTVAPTVVVSGASPTLNASQTDLITFTFSEAVIGFDLADLAVSGGTLGAITAVDATHYTATFTPTIGATAAAIQVLASGTGTSSWTDAAGNPGTASNTFAISENTVAPTVVVSGASPTLNASQTDLITFTFSEAVIGFDLADLAVSGGTLGAITAVDATHYTATFTPTIGATAAAIQVLASGTGTSSWTDAAGNPGTASNTFAISENTVAPTVVVSGASPTLNASQTDLITFTFSEAVIGFDLADLAVSGGTLGAITAVDATHYTATFTPTIGATAA